MEGKKRYVAIVLFLLIGLTVFTFANPVEEQKGSKGNGSSSDTEVTEKEDNTSDGTLGPVGNQQQNQNLVQVPNQNQGVGETEADDTSYEDALEAVVRAEATFDELDIENARDLIDLVTNEEQKEELTERVDIIEEAIEAIKLVEELEKMVEEAAERDDIEDSIDYRTDNQIVQLVDALRNEEIQESLQDRLQILSRILDDETAPKYEGVTDGETTNEDVSITYSDADSETGVENEVTVSVTLNGKDIDFADTFTEEGEYVVTLRDEAFNETIITFTIDKTAAKYHAVNANVNGYKNEVKTQYAKNGNTITAYISMNEELAHNPTFKFYINGKKVLEVAKEDVIASIGNNTEYPYVYTAKLKIDENVEAEDGLITFKVVDIVDKAGTKSDDITKMTPTGKTLNLDRTAAKAKYVAILSKGPNYKYAKNGDTIRFLVAFNEEVQIPSNYKDGSFILEINGKEVHFMRSQGAGYEYIAEYKIPENEANLAEGELTFAISGYTDVAGNVGETLTDATHGTYNKVIYDRTPVEYNKLWVKGGTYDKETGKRYATNGDRIEFYVTFKEEVETLPTIVINGLENLTFTMKQTKTNPLQYYVTYTVKENDGLKDGEISIAVSGYTDKAGNVGAVLTNKDFNVGAQNHVIIDKTPVAYNKLWVKGGTYDKETGKRYATNGDRIEFYVTFKEEVETLPTIVINGLENLTFTMKQAKNNPLQYYVTYTVKENDGLVDGEISIAVSGYTDKAGNPGKVLTNENFNVGAQNHVIIDKTPVEYNKLWVKGGTYDKETGKRYATVGDTIEFYVSFKEAVVTKPTIVINGLENLTFTMKQAKNNPLQYYVTYKVKENDGLEDGEIQVEVSGYTDKAGNPGKVLTNENFNVGAQNHVIIDKTPVEYNKLWVKGGTYDKETGKRYATVGDTIEFYVSFKEAVVTKPTIVVNGDENLTFTMNQTKNSPLQYYVTYKVKENDGLKDGEISIAVSGYTDKAGNPGKVLTNKDFNVGAQNHVIIDKTAPVINSTTYSIDTFTQENVTVTITLSEKIKAVEGWTLSEDGKALTKEFTENAEGTIEIFDLAGNKVIAAFKVANIDREKPVVTPSYTEKTISEDSVEEFTEVPTFEVTDNSNAKVSQELISGEVNPHKVGTYTLVYRFTDLAGNYTDVTVTVKVVDQTEPVITVTGENKDNVYKTATVTVSDKHLKKATYVYSFEGVVETKELPLLINGYTFKLNGTYTIKAVDKSGNETSVTFTVDGIAPKILLLDKIEYIQGDILPIKPVILDENLDIIVVKKNGQVIPYSKGDQLKDNGEYEIIATDKAGNTSTAKFEIDNKNPQIQSPDIIDLGVYKEFPIEIDDDNYEEGNFIILKQNGYDKLTGKLPIYEKYELEDDVTTLTEEGSYYIIAYDKAYNLAVKKVIIDKTKPVINDVEDKHYNISVTPVIVEENLLSSTITKDYNILDTKEFTSGTEITEEGTYTILVTDKAKQAATVTFVIDKSAPEINAPVGQEVLRKDNGTVNVVASANDTYTGKINNIIPTVIKTVEGVEENLGQQETIDVSVAGVSYKLLYTTEDKAGNKAELTVETVVTNITYELKFNLGVKYTTTYNGTAQKAIPSKDDVVLTMTKDANPAVTITDEEILSKIVFNTPEYTNAGKYDITASVEINGNTYTTEKAASFEIEKATISLTFPEGPLAKDTTLAQIIESVSVSGIDKTALEFKLYRNNFGLPLVKEVSSVDKTGLYIYGLSVTLKEGYEANYKLMDLPVIEKLDINGKIYTAE